MRTLVFVILMGLPMTPCFAEKPAGIDLATVAQESQAAAKASLATFNQLLTEENAQRMGFANPSEAGQSQLGAPLSDFLVGLDALREYQPGKDPMSLLKPTGQVVYPVKVGETVRSSVILKKQGNEWKAVSFGSPMLSKAVHGTSETVAKRDRLAASELFQVRIPAFNLVFVGQVSSGKLMLTSIADADRYGLKAGATQAAADIFARLKPEAERDNGLPR